MSHEYCATYIFIKSCLGFPLNTFISKYIRLSCLYLQSLAIIKVHLFVQKQIAAYYIFPLPVSVFMEVLILLLIIHISTVLIGPPFHLFMQHITLNTFRTFSGKPPTIWAPEASKFIQLIITQLYIHI